MFLAIRAAVHAVFKLQLSLLHRETLRHVGEHARRTRATETANA